MKYLAISKVLNKITSGQSDVPMVSPQIVRRGSDETDGAWEWGCWRLPLTAVLGFKSCHWPFKTELSGRVESWLPADVQCEQLYVHTLTFSYFSTDHRLLFPQPQPPTCVWCEVGAGSLSKQEISKMAFGRCYFIFVTACVIFNGETVYHFQLGDLLSN